MNHALILLLSFIGSVLGLAAYLREPSILLALAFLPAIMDSMPFGLAAAQIQADAPQAAGGDEIEDERRPIGFTQDILTKK